MNDLFLNKENQMNKKTPPHPTSPKALKTKKPSSSRAPILYYQNLWHSKMKSSTFTPSCASLRCPTLIK